MNTSIRIIVIAAVAFAPLLAMPQASAPSELNKSMTKIGQRLQRNMLWVLRAILLCSLGGAPLFAQAPTLTSLSPNNANAGSPALTLTLTGTNFDGSSQVRWNGSPGLQGSLALRS